MGETIIPAHIRECSNIKKIYLSDGIVEIYDSCTTIDSTLDKKRVKDREKYYNADIIIIENDEKFLFLRNIPDAQSIEFFEFMSDNNTSYKIEFLGNKNSKNNVKLEHVPIIAISLWVFDKMLLPFIINRLSAFIDRLKYSKSKSSSVEIHLQVITQYNNSNSLSKVLEYRGSVEGIEKIDTTTLFKE